MKSSNPKNSANLQLSNLEASESFAEFLAEHMISPMVIGFSGEIGMGKTTIIRSLLQKLGVSSRIKSPTFSLVETYNLQKFTLHHFDLYRIQDESELDYIGFRDYFGANDICCIEWPEQLGDYALDLDLILSLSWLDTGRSLNIMAKSSKGHSILDAIKGRYEELPIL